ncbi:hypothetical protein FH972_015750 [Carpinus fangiana]|uniref:Uncharacterized protein n=1 Tax=Carpinus fangiana TaxID=176857 RepID=A0A5N6RH27_9ROSI|nr:hypothetical protein FH972_015750 [Carpinus fangiana]
MALLLLTTSLKRKIKFISTMSFCRAWGSPVGHLLKITSSKLKEAMLCYTLLLQSETEENMGPLCTQKKAL